MDSFFEKNSPATKFLTAVSNLIIVNLVFIISCIPIITIGASLTGLYRVTFKILNGDEVSVIRDFFQSFRSNLVNSTKLWIPYVLINAFFSFEIFLVVGGMQGTSNWMIVPIVIVMVILFSIFIYTVPLLAMFDDSFKQTIKNAALLSVGNFPTTLMIAIIHLATGYVLYLRNIISVVIFSLLLFIGFALIAFVCAFFLNRTLPKSTKIDVPIDDEEAED